MNSPETNTTVPPVRGEHRSSRVADNGRLFGLCRLPIALDRLGICLATPSLESGLYCIVEKRDIILGDQTGQKAVILENAQGCRHFLRPILLSATQRLNLTYKTGPH